jgi:hypothetical protein
MERWDATRSQTIHLELLDGAELIHQKAYHVAHAHQEVFLKELKHLVKIGMLEWCGATEWASPMFIISKKDGRIQWVLVAIPPVSDARCIAKKVRVPVFHESWSNNVLLNLRVGWWKSWTLHHRHAVWKIKYHRLPMGIKQSPDFAQEIIEEVLWGLDIEAYIDDVGCFDNDWESHLNSLDAILRCLEINGFTVNPLKCKWGFKRNRFLGHCSWLPQD